LLVILAVSCSGKSTWFQYEDDNKEADSAEDFYSGVYGYWDYGPGAILKYLNFSCRRHRKVPKNLF
jgi:hypothetical protein